MINKGDFIEITYTGRLADGTVFDTTQESIGKKAGLNERAVYKPIIICIGEGHLLSSLDDYLEGKDIGKHVIEISSEKGFGKKDSKLLKLIPLQKFTDHKIQPHVGLEVNIDNHYGIVRSIASGRVTVDFNHPLAGKDLLYELEVTRKVEKKEEQVAAILTIVGLHHHGVVMENEAAIIKVHELLPQPMAQNLNDLITKLTAVKTLTYQVDKANH